MRQYEYTEKDKENSFPHKSTLPAKSASLSRSRPLADIDSSLNCDEELDIGPVNYPNSSFAHASNFNRSPSFSSFYSSPLVPSSIPNLGGFEELEELEELKEEEELEENTWRHTFKDYFQALLMRQSDYEKPQIVFDAVTEAMRAILLDWMMEVCSEFTLKRETFHLSMYYVDLALSRMRNVSKANFQLVGLAAMCVASKNEEIYNPRVKDWARSADNGYSCSEIKRMERQLLGSLDWKIFPSTPYTWLNWMMGLWDSFVEFHFGCVPFNKPSDFQGLVGAESIKKAFEKRFIVFKYSNKQAYRRFRETMQVLDIGLMDPHAIAISPRELASGLLYLMVSKYFYKTNYALLYFDGEEIDMNQEDTVQSAHVLQELFAEFLREAAEVNGIKEIFEAVNLFHQYLDIEVVYDLPIVCSVESKKKIESHYHEFLAYQTHNPQNLEFLHSRQILS